MAASAITGSHSNCHPRAGDAHHPVTRQSRNGTRNSDLVDGRSEIRTHESLSAPHAFQACQGVRRSRQNSAFPSDRRAIRPDPCSPMSGNVWLNCHPSCHPQRGPACMTLTTLAGVVSQFACHAPRQPTVESGGAPRRILYLIRCPVTGWGAARFPNASANNQGHDRYRNRRALGVHPDDAARAYGK
jgi:hypothetical protein